MNRAVRGLFIAVAWVFVTALAFVYPLLARSDALDAKFTQLWWLLAIPIIPLVLWRMTLGADSRIPRLAISTIAPLKIGPRGWRTSVRDVPGILRGAALVLAIVALARPQSILRGETSEEQGIDIVIVLDLSTSMAAVMDTPNTPPNPLFTRQGLRPTRLDVAKEVIVDFVSRRHGDRIGVVVFGRSAFVLSPPTLDYGLLTNLVGRVQLEDVDGAGTAIGDAVGTAVARLRRSTARSKAVILLTDGDSNSGSISPEYSGTLAQSQGVRLYTVQIGNGDDVDVLVGFDMFGQPRYERRRYPVNPELLQKLAKTTDGESFVANDRAALEQSMHSILDRLEKTRFSAQSATMEDLFPFVLAPAVVLVVLEAFVRLVLLRRFP